MLFRQCCVAHSCFCNRRRIISPEICSVVKLKNILNVRIFDLTTTIRRFAMLILSVVGNKNVRHSAVLYSYKLSEISVNSFKRYTIETNYSNFLVKSRGVYHWQLLPMDMHIAFFIPLKLFTSNYRYELRRFVQEMFKPLKKWIFKKTFALAEVHYGFINL